MPERSSSENETHAGPKAPSDVAADENRATAPLKRLTPEAERALAEAADRRAANDAATSRAKEIGGRDGPDPVRYGDWETGGIASDF